MNCPKWKNLSRQNKELAKAMGGYKNFKKAWYLADKLHRKMLKEYIEKAPTLLPNVDDRSRYVNMTLMYGFNISKSSINPAL